MTIIWQVDEVLRNSDKLFLDQLKPLMDIYKQRTCTIFPDAKIRAVVLGSRIRMITAAKRCQPTPRFRLQRSQIDGRQLTRVVEARHVIHVQMETTKRPLGRSSPRQGEWSCKGRLNMLIGTVTDWGTRWDSCMGIFALGGAHCQRPQSQNSPLSKPFRSPTMHRKPRPPHMHDKGGGTVP